MNHAVIRLTTAELASLRGGSSQSAISLPDGDLLRCLLDQQFLLESHEPEETSVLKQRFGISLSEARNYGITFGLTLKCNFRCTYCYQRSSMGRMTSETFGRIRRHFLNRRDSVGKFGAVWFGGEPLLHLSHIVSESAFYISACDERDIPYSADLITNGYLLTPSTVEQLQQCRISDLQITLDGYNEAHDKTRRLASGAGTYRRIMANLSAIEGKIPNIRIRVNVSSQHAYELLPLIDSLAQLRTRVALYLMPVHCLGIACDGNLDSSHYRNYLNWDAWFEQVELYAIERGIEVLTARHYSGLPYCNGYARNCIVVDPEANVYYCVGDIGLPEKRAGYLNMKGDFVSNEGKEHLQSPDPLEIDQCSACDVLPLCMGGCYSLPIKGATTNGRCMMKALFPVNLAKALELGVPDPIAHAT